MPRAFGELVAAGVRPDAPFVHWRDTTLTYGDITDAVEELAGRLRRAGVASDTAVAARVPSTPIGIVMTFGIWATGAVCAPVPPDLSDDTSSSHLGLVGPGVVLMPSNDEGSLVAQVVARAAPTHRYAEDAAFVATLARAGGRWESVELTDAAIEADTGRELDGYGDPPDTVVALPLASWTGMREVVAAARRGGAIALAEGASAEAFAAAVRALGATDAVLDPATVAALDDAPGVPGLDPLRDVRSPAAPVSDAAARTFRGRFGITVANTYGRTLLGGEVVGWSAVDRRRDADAKLGSIGRPRDGIELTVVRSDGTAADVDEVGEIRIRPPLGVRGEAVQARLDGAGRVCTGDAGWHDRDGFVWLRPEPDPTG